MKIEPNILNHVVSIIISGSEFSVVRNYQNVCICCLDGKIVFRTVAEKIREMILGGLLRLNLNVAKDDQQTSSSLLVGQRNNLLSSVPYAALERPL